MSHNTPPTATPPAEFAGFYVAPGWRFACRHRVHWSECDPYRHANHRAYLEWFEDARNQYLELMGVALHPDEPGPVLAETTIRYRRPLPYGAEVLVTARTVHLGRTSIGMEYAAWDASGLVAECRAVLILVVNATGAKTAITPELRARITRYEAATGASALPPL